MTIHGSSTAKIPWRFLLVTWLILTAVTTSVPVVDWLRRPTGSVFTGYSYESVGDIFGYLNMIEQAERGRVMFIPIMSAMQNTPGFFNPFFLLIGWGGRLFHLSPLIAWHVARVVIMFFMIVLLWKVLVFLVEEEKMRRYILVGMLVVSGTSPNSHESSLFVSLLYSPLTLAMLCLMLGLTLASWDIAARGFRWQNAAVVAGVLCSQAFIQPYALPVMTIVPVAWAALLYVQKKILRYTFFRMVVLVGLASAVTFYSLYFTATHNPVIREYAVSFRNTFWPAGVVTVFVLLFLPSAYAWVLHKKTTMFTHSPSLWMVVWLGITLLLMVVPYPYASRLVSVVHLPLEFFAVAGLITLWRGGWTLFHHRPFALVMTAALLYTPVTHLAANWLGGYDVGSMKYLDVTMQNGFTWIRNNTPTDAIFFVAPSWDTLFPQQANRRSYAISSGFQSDFGDRAQNAVHLLAGYDSPEQLSAFVLKNHISYILVSEKERKFGAWVSMVFDPSVTTPFAFRFSPKQYAFLHMVYAADGFQVFQVRSSL